MLFHLDDNKTSFKKFWEEDATLKEKFISDGYHYCQTCQNFSATELKVWHTIGVMLNGHLIWFWESKVFPRIFILP